MRLFFTFSLLEVRSELSTQAQPNWHHEERKQSNLLQTIFSFTFWLILHPWDIFLVFYFGLFVLARHEGNHACQWHSHAFLTRTHDCTALLSILSVLPWINVYIYCNQLFRAIIENFGQFHKISRKVPIRQFKTCKTTKSFLSILLYYSTFYKNKRADGN